MVNPRSNDAVAIGSATILMVLIDKLIAKGLLTRREARDVLRTAIDKLAPRNNIATIGDAIDYIDQLLVEFPEQDAGER